MLLKNLSKEPILIAALVVFKLVLHFLSNTNYELHRDAFLYLALGDHLDFGYISVPPLTALVARMITGLFGDSVFAIRLFPALVGAASVAVIGLLVRELGGRARAILLAGLAFILSPAFLRSNTLFQPVSFNQFAWLLSGYFIVKLLKTREPKFWLHLGILWGIAFLNKYAIAFFVLSFLISLLLTRDRSLLHSRQFVVGALIGLALILPNLIWQYTHNWPVVEHMMELQRTQLVNVQPGDFLLMQFIMNLHAVPLWLFGLIFLLFLQKGRQFQVLGFTFITVLLLLLLLSGKPYYTLGVYPILFAAGGVAMEKYAENRLRFLRPALLALMALIALPVVPYSLPILPLDKMTTYAEASKKFGLEAVLRWEDGRIHALPQDYADMVGWQELADIVIRTYSGLSEEEKAGSAIYASNYGQAGAIKYFGKKYGLPEPVCFNATFLLWAPDSVNFTTLIYIDSDLDEDIASYFGDIRQVGRLSNVHARESGRSVFLCKQPRQDFAKYYQSLLRRLKNRYSLPDSF